MASKLKPAEEVFTIGDWTVKFFAAEKRIVGGAITQQRKVTLAYKGKIYNTGHGKVFSTTPSKR